MTEQQQVQSKAFIFMLIGGVMIAFSPIFMRYASAISEVSTTAAAFWRVSLSLPLLGLVFLLKRGVKDRFSPQILARKDMWLVGLFFAGDLAFWHWSVKFTTVANATLLANMASVFTALFGFLFFKERFSRKFLMGMGLSLIGAVTLMGRSLEASPENLFGDLLGVITALCYAGYILASNWARKRYSTLQLMFWGGLITAFFLWPIAMMEEDAFFPSSVSGWWPLLGLAWISHFLGQGLILYGLAHLSAAMGSVSLLIQPLMAALLASFLFAEKLTYYHLVGGLLIITGIMVCRKGQNKPSLPPSGAVVTVIDDVIEKEATEK